MSREEWIEVGPVSIRLTTDSEGRHSVFSPDGYRKLRYEDMTRDAQEAIDKAKEKC